MNSSNKELIVGSNSDTEIDRDDVGTLYIGQFFPTLDACYAYYCLYAGKLGFDVCKSSQKKYLNNRCVREVAGKVFVCNKEGKVSIIWRKYQQVS